MTAAVGVATTVAPFDELKPAGGDQVYEEAPLAVSVALLPSHKATFEGVTVTVGCASGRTSIQEEPP
jgi:hypothetical protein